MNSKGKTPKWLLVMIMVVGVLFALNGTMSLLRKPDLFALVYVGLGVVMVFSMVVAMKK